MRIDKSKSTVIIVLFLFYPTIVKVLAEGFNCVNIEGESRLFGDLEEKCFEGTHLLIIIFVAIPGFLVLVIGIPFYGAW